MRKWLRTIAAVSLIALGAVAASSRTVQAGTASATLAVSATVANNCTISTAALAFGGYDPIVAQATTDLDGSGTVTIKCTKGSAPNIELDLGGNASGATRRMVSSGSFLNYELYQDASHTTVWGSGSAKLTPAVTPSASPRSFSVYGRVTSGQDVPAGSYADTVTATVNF